MAYSQADIPECISLLLFNRVICMFILQNRCKIWLYNNVLVLIPNMVIKISISNHKWTIVRL